MEPPTHTPDPDDMRELCGLVACMRAWACTHGDEYDPGREHPLYPRKQWRNGSAHEGPLWAALETVLRRHGYGLRRNYCMGANHDHGRGKDDCTALG
jgi:hypothetical protein